MVGSVGGWREGGEGGGGRRGFGHTLRGFGHTLEAFKGGQVRTWQRSGGGTEGGWRRRRRRWGRERVSAGEALKAVWVVGVAWGRWGRRGFGHTLEALKYL